MSLPPTLRSNACGRPRAHFSLLVVSLLALGALSILGAPTQAQFNVFGAGTGGGDLGWTWPAAELPGTLHEDVPNDRRIDVAGEAALPANTADLYAASELESLEIVEADEERLLFRIKTADMTPGPEDRDPTMTVPSFTITFEQGAVQYEIAALLWADCEATDPCQAFTPVAWMRATTTGDSTLWFDDVPARVDAERDVLELLVPRWAFSAADGSPAPDVGDAVSNLHLRSTRAEIGVFCFGDGCLSGTARLVDNLPDEGVLYEAHVFSLPSTGSMFSINANEAVPAPDTGPRGAATSLGPRTLPINAEGGAATVQLVLTNHASSKLLVRPQLTVLSHHNLANQSLPEHLEIRAGESIAFVVALRTDDPIPSTDPLRAMLRFEGVGIYAGHVDQIRITMRDAPPLGPNNPILYMHANSQAFADLDHPLFQDTNGFLSTIKDEPNDDGYGGSAAGCCFSGPRQWSMDAPLQTAVALDLDREGLLELHLDAPVAGELEAAGWIMTGEAEIASYETVVRLEPGQNTLQIPLLLHDDIKRLRAGAHLAWWPDWQFRPIDDVPISALATDFAPQAQPTLVTGGSSFIQLPFVESSTVRPNVFDLSLLLADDDVARYVNPGGTTYWEMTLLNQGSAEERVEVALSNVTSGWSATTVPGNAYRIGPGESVTFAVELVAPAEAEEGAIGTVDVSLYPDSHPAAVARLAFGAVVTTGVELADARFEADNETTARTEAAEVEQTPALGTWAIVAPLLAYGATQRRSRHTPPAAHVPTCSPQTLSKR